MFISSDIINIMFGAGLVILLVALYIIYVFIKLLNDESIDDLYEANHESRHHELTEEFVKNKIKD